VYSRDSERNFLIMATKAEIRKQKKRKDRERRIRKAFNVRRNAPDAVYRLDVLLDGQWREGIKTFSSMASAVHFRDDTERLRLKGDLIVPGKVIDTRDGSVVIQIAGSPEKIAGASDKGALPDKLADNPSADKVLTGFIQK